MGYGGDGLGIAGMGELGRAGDDVPDGVDAGRSVSSVCASTSTKPLSSFTWVCSSPIPSVSGPLPTDIEHDVDFGGCLTGGNHDGRRRGTPAAQRGTPVVTFTPALR